MRRRREYLRILGVITISFLLLLILVYVVLWNPFLGGGEVEAPIAKKVEKVEKVEEPEIVLEVNQNDEKEVQKIIEAHRNKNNIGNKAAIAGENGDADINKYLKLVRKPSESEDSEQENISMPKNEFWELYLSKKVKLKEFTLSKNSRIREFFNFEKRRRYYVYISTDRQTYRPGEKIYLKGTILDVFDHKPIQMENCNIQIHVSLKNEKGEIIGNDNFQSIRNSVFAVEIPIPITINGGSYSIRISQPKRGHREREVIFSPTERKIRIWKYTNPRFIKSIEYGKKSYGKDEIIGFYLRVRRSEGGFLNPKTSEVTCSVQLSTEEYPSKVIKTIGNINMEEGESFHSFSLDSSIDKKEEFDKIMELRGVEGWVTCYVNEGIMETVTKRIPFIEDSIFIRFFPSGGVFLENIENDVFFDAHSSEENMEDIVDIEGELLDLKTNEVIIPKIISVHEGSGVFQFTPEHGVSYGLRITKPRTNQIIELSSSKNLKLLSNNGVAIQFSENEKIGVFSEFETIKFRLLRVGKKIGNIHLGIFKKEEVLVYKQYTFEESSTFDVSISPEDIDGKNGVLRITIFDDNFLLITERLIFVRPKDYIIFDLEYLNVPKNNVYYSPGDIVEFKVTPKSRITGNVFEDAVYSVIVTDTSALESVEKRKRHPNLVHQVYLENEIFGTLYDSKKYFYDPLSSDDINDEVNQNFYVSYLLGIQGWRRFIYDDILESYEKFRTNEKNLELFKRLLGIEEEEHEFFEFPRIQKMRGREMMKNAVADFGGGIGDAAENAENAMGNPNIMNDELFREDGGGEGFEDDLDEEEDVDVVVHDEFVQHEKIEKKAENLLKKKIRDAFIWFNSAKSESLFKYSKDLKKDDSLRSEFQETLLFQPSNKGVSKSVNFQMNDAITSFRVIIEGFDKTGTIGSSDHFLVRNIKPFFVEAKLPVELSFGDLVDIPIEIVNNFAFAVENVEIKVLLGDGLENEVSKIELFSVPEKSRLSKYLGIKCSSNIERKKVLVQIEVTGTYSKDGKTNKIMDKFEKFVSIVSSGFPYTKSFSGILDSSKTKKIVFKLPNDSLVPSTFSSSLFLHPTSLGALVESIKSLIRIPSGCFEQTSSTMFPMIMALQYLQNQNLETSSEYSALVKDIFGKLETGYKKLISYEVEGGGFEWFGKSPAHESLTAMGLAEFVELQKTGFQIDSTLIPRTLKWLVSRIKSSNDGFKISKAALDSFGYAPANIQDTYIFWSLSQTKLLKWDDIEQLGDNLFKNARNSEDAYIQALTGLALFNFGKNSEAELLAEHVSKYVLFQNEVKKTEEEDSGSVDLKFQTTSVTNSRNRNLQIDE